MAERDLPPAAHETSDVAIAPVLTGLALIGVTLLGLAAFAFWLFPIVDRRIALPLPRYPAPQLQTDPAADMQAFLAQEQHVLNGAGWVDQAHGVAHIPIATAMRTIARRGIPDWPRSP